MLLVIVEGSPPTKSFVSHPTKKRVRNKEFHVGPSVLNTIVYKLAIDTLCNDLNPGRGGGESPTTAKRRKRGGKRTIRKYDFRKLLNTVDEV